ncbi:Molybdopterin molybdenumtransferase [Zhongshania aliphaticivorans]|uniref:Molybdopterin molybdenumtransferase n=1 Tax=Zhongshania aliphaticivorans TaxID=1470434 RepID=A0A5S9QL54_9GAMM|nr:gephyrin-like molybdotransferase Glp [Zhongshania aliphaticivorans]CAA0111811.1 Molybdopterin molybdenumtransferase [Zhongshania aliphaticivorans]CAA0118839.1 Molybdopterin molybdenumtransferase [Zhongshania aliphaticivorans]
MLGLRAVDDVLHYILSDAPIGCVKSEVSALYLGAVLDGDVFAERDVPPADNSAMDGFAFRYEDLLSGKSLPVSQRIPAGIVGEELQEGTAARIFTGAFIPPNADTVVAQEDCELSGNQVTVSAGVKRGQHIRPRGQDISAGQLLFEAGHRLQAADLGLLASLGISRLSVSAPIRVALMSTGDELREPGESLSAGQIYNSNRPMLAAMIRSLGCEVVDLGIIPDNASATKAALLDASTRADVVISSGGVSVGEEDHVKAQVEALGELQLWKLAIKPGKPLAYGRLGAAPFFGLPGNPVSSFVTFCLFVRPYLLKMLGVANPVVAQWPANANFSWPKAGSRQEYLRARVTPGVSGMQVDIHPQQSSGALTSVSWCNALAVIPVGVTLQRGDHVEVIFLRDLY